MQDNPHFAEEEQWVIWNGTLGILDTVIIGEVEVNSSGRCAWLDEPYDMVGPFSLDELEAEGQISFAACVVMSRQKWRDDQVELRREAHKNRRAAQERLQEEFEAYVRSKQSRSWSSAPIQRQKEKQHRELLNLPMEGQLEISQIKAAYRRLAQKTHPDVGGSHDQFVQITEARNALIECIS